MFVATNNNVSMNYFFFCLALLFFSVGFSQEEEDPTEKRDKIPSYFGLQFRPIFPTRFIGKPTTTLSKDGFTTSVSQALGYSFGGIVRVGITKLIAFETGINFVERHFNVEMSLPDSSLSARNIMTFISYDVPLNALVYIQLSKRIYANASLGIAATFKPSNVGIVNSPGGANTFTHTGFVQNKFALDFNANFGFEYRTEKSGFFYIGGTAKVPFRPLFDLIAQYKNQGNKTTIYGQVDGTFLTLDFKYFFPNIRNKGTQFMKGPID
jgi:hypothetical protein